MKITLATPLLLSLLMIGCGGSGGKSTNNNSSTPSANNPPPAASSVAPVSSAAGSSLAPSSPAPASQAASSAAPLLTGVFLDAAVMNIGYRTASQQGFTNANGEFNYRPGETITFFIGDLEFPPVMAGDIVTPMDIANTDDLGNHQLINILRLLQSLDIDGDVSNGIGISSDALANGVMLDFTLPPEVFAQLPAVQELLQVAGSVNKQLVSSEQAVAHFQTTLEFINGPGSSSSSSQSSAAVATSSVAPSSQAASSIAPSSAATSSLDIAPTPLPPESSAPASSAPAVASSSSLSSAAPVSSAAPASSASSAETGNSSAAETSSAGQSSAVAESSAESSVSSEQISSASSSATPVVRPAKMEGFAAHENVTGGAGGAEITVTTGTELNAALCSRASMSTPIVIKVNGTISHANTTAQGCNTQADVIEIKAMSNVSIIGVGSNALFEEMGIHVRDASNIILQNLHIRNVKKSGSPTSNGGDAIGMETNVDRVWIDHNWLEASGGEKDGYDSLLDMKAGVTNVTVSYNLFNDSSRAGLIGSSDSDNKNTNITFHHNWYKNIEQRTPLIRHALVHMYNNYWSNERLDYMFHAINSRSSGKVLVENNYMYNVNNPLIASDDSPTAGCWQTNNDNTVLPEIYYSRTVGNGALVVPEVVDGQLQSTCAVTVPYSVEMDPTADVPAIVMANVGVGKIDGGSGGNSSASSVANSQSSAANSSQSNSSVATSTEASSSSAASSVVAGANLAINEAFNVDKTTLFSAAYQAISTDSSAALYYITGGGSGITVSNNELTLAGGRLTIGNRPPRANTTSGDVSANGDFDLSRPYRISFKVVAGSGSGKFQVYVDNNTTSSGNSIHGANSKVFEAVASSFSANQQVVITPAVGTSTSFIALRAESSATVTIDDVVVEYLDQVGASSSSEAAVSSVPASSAESSSSLAASSAPASSVDASSSVASSEEASSSVQSSEAQSSEAQSSAPASSEASSSVSSVSNVFIDEGFNVDKDTLFSAFYHAISTDSSAALYYITGGGSGITISNNELTLAGARLTIGHRPPRANTTSGDVSVNGDFDLSRPYRISFKVVAGSGSGKFQVYVDNNTTGSSNSLHGASSRVYDVVASSLAANQQVVITPPVGTSTSFIALRTESSATVTIDDLVIEYTDGLGVSSSSVATGGQSSATTSSSAAVSSAQSSSVAVSASSRSSGAYVAPVVNLSADCISLATNPNVNWRDTALQTDQEIVECLSQSLGKPVGYGENAKGGYDPNGNSKLTIITKTGGVSVEQQLIDALTDNAHNWIVFDKVEFAQAYEIGMYRQYCADAATLSVLGTTEAECRDYRSWCANKGFNDEATCRTEFFNKTMNKSNIPIRIPAIGSNKTLDGRGSEAYFIFSGFAIGKDSDGVPTQTSESVILTHLKFQGAGHTEDHYVDPDMIRSTGASHDIWIHKNTFDTTGDSAFDVKIGANAITMSFNRLQNVKRAVLHGSSDSRTINANITTTMHHNAFVTTDDSYMLLGNTLRRVPLLRRGKTHMFNNVFVNYRKEVLSLRVGASAFLEDNAFVVNSSLQEKSSVEASLSEIANNYFKDISGGFFRNDRNFLWFGSGTCVVNDATKTTLTATNGSVADLTENYNAASLNMFNGWRFDAGQDLVDYVTLTAGKHGDVPFNSPLSADRTYMEALTPVSCQ